MIQISRFARHALATAIVGMAIDGARTVPATMTCETILQLWPRGFNHMGFLDWRKLRWDHGYWKIDDARRENGHIYDLKLEAGTLDIVRLERENH